MTDVAGPFTLAALERCEADVAAAERALVDLESGSFGRCDACGAPVEPDALAADPFAHRCGQHRDPAGQVTPTA